jgi:PilZ domain/Uncharacterized ACR, COG1430
MKESPFIHFATAPKFEGPGGSTGTPGFQPGAEPSRVCAYNQTRERFISVEVDAGDFAPAVLATRLPSLTSGCGTALWILPFRGISATSVRFPIDLIFLDERGVVLSTVDSFPISPMPASGSAPASVLALPAQSIASTGTSRGDRLLLHPAEEMKLRLQQLARAKAENQQERSGAPPLESGSYQPSPAAGANVLPFDRSRPTPEVEKPASANPAAALNATPIEVSPRPVIETPVQPDPVLAPAAPPAAAEPKRDQPWAKRFQAPKGWLGRLLSSEPADPRASDRLAIPWLAAYFFTGGKPVAYAVRDISSSGLYVLTEERWYPGTVIRVTLTDGRHPTPDRSFTAHAIVVRAGNDGVGLHFVLNEDKRSGRNARIDSHVPGVDREAVELFLHRIRSAQ